MFYTIKLFHNRYEGEIDEDKINRYSLKKTVKSIINHHHVELVNEEKETTKISENITGNAIKGSQKKGR